MTTRVRAVTDDAVALTMSRTRTTRQATGRASSDSLRAYLTDEITTCRACPRLVAWREQVAREKRAAFRDETYWGRPVPGFGDPRARVLVLGLAPAAHGANRTGRVFTGDRSGDWLFASMYRTGLANQPTSVASTTGSALRGAYVTRRGAVRAAGEQADAGRARHAACRSSSASWRC